MVPGADQSLAGMSTERQWRSMEDQHSLLDWDLTSPPLPPLSSGQRARPQRPRLSQVVKRRLVPWCGVHSELRVKLPIQTFPPTLGEGKLGLRHGLNRHPEGREGEVFLGQEEDCLVVPTRCTGSTWAVWNLGCLPVGSSSPFIHVAHPMTSAEWKHLTSDITVAQGNRHLHLKLYWEEQGPPNCKTQVEGKERCKCFIHRKAAAMALGLFRVCLVVVTAIINHPLLFPRENATVPENEEEIIRQMQAHQEKMQLEQLRLEEEMARLAADKEAEKEALEQVAEEGQQQNESRTAWDLWSTLCMILFLVIEVWRQDHQDAPSPECLGSDEDELPDLEGAPLRGLTLPNRATLDHFYERCIRGATADAARTREFVEGFVDDLLEALRSLCSRDSDMEVEDFIGVDSMYENWQVNKPLLCDLFVPFMPPEPYHFHPELWCSSRSVPLDRQGYGQIKVVRADEDTLGCICGKTKLGEDMLCLLHGRNNVVHHGSKAADPLCAPNSPYLDTMRVMKWFQTALTRAWHRIEHKYEFDLAFGQLDTPGSLKIRFRSGKFMPFNLIPVIQCDDSDLYFVSHLAREPGRGTRASSTDWLLSFAVYERHFLRVTSKALPEGACHLSCLQIASFLLSKQNRLTGPSGLGNYHLKTALLHLLLARRPADWKAEQLDARLHELLCFLEKSLLEKKLQHFFIGNRKVPEAMGLPEAVRRAEPLNLFRPFVLQRSLYRKTVDSFYEMLKNAPALISEYSLHIPSDHASLPPKTVIL